MENLKHWLNEHKISFSVLDAEVVEIEDFGKMYLADITGVKSILKGEEGSLTFNLPESPEVLMEEDIYYVAFPFGRNYYYYDLRERFRFNILKYMGKRQPTQLQTAFVNLGVHTPFELLNGSGDLSVWVKKAAYLGHEALGICDQNTMAASLNLQKECQQAGIKHVFGYSLTLVHAGEQVGLKVYSQTNQGLRNLLRIQKDINVGNPSQGISLHSLLSYGEGNVLVFEKMSSYWLHQHPSIATQLTEAFQQVFYQFDVTEYKAERLDVEVLKAAQFYFDHFYLGEGHFKIEPILICDNYYPDQDDARSKIILNKIATGGAAHYQSSEQYYKDTDELFAMFKDVFDESKWNVRALFERMCQHTVEIAAGASAKFETGKMYMPEYMMLPEEKEKYCNRHTMFIQLLLENLNKKVPKHLHSIYQERLNEEIYIIESTNNVDYFLIQYDIVKEAKKRGIATGVGRGSAGGSLVSFLLGITSIDPIRYELLFSRFLVPERCGLNWADQVSVIGEDVSIPKNTAYVLLHLGSKCYYLLKDAELRIRRGQAEMTVKGDELQAGDDIIFDHRDLIWTLNEIGKC